MLSKKYRFFCLRIEKNASKSFRRLLEKYCDKNYSVLAGISYVTNNLYDVNLAYNQFLSSYFKFVFVRNPYKRIVSYYFHLNKRENFPYLEELELGSKESFYEFVKNFNPRGKRKYINQYDYLIDHTGKNIFDYIGKLETIEEDLKNISDKIHLDITDIPHVNQSEYYDYKELYTDETYDLVTKKFRKDIEKFNYTF